MPVKQFPWLADIERTVRAKVDLPADEPGQVGWSWDAEFSQACNDEYLHLWERLSSLDRDFGLTWDDTVTAMAGAETTDLPVAVRSLRKVFKLDAAGKVCGQVDFVTLDQSDGCTNCCDGAGMYLPDTNQIRWLAPWEAAQPLRLVFNGHPVPLAHGCCSENGGAASLTLALHESLEDDAYNGLLLRLAEGPGAGAERALTDYVGNTRIASINPATPFTVSPTTRTRYTSRPNLRMDAKNPFVYGVTARLLEKLQDERWIEYSERRETYLRNFQTAAMLTSKHEAFYTRDGSETGGHGDPAWTL